MLDGMINNICIPFPDDVEVVTSIALVEDVLLVAASLFLEMVADCLHLPERPGLEEGECCEEGDLACDLQVLHAA